ncbi:hypothetical protein D3C80_1327070 [compost metagenome]
MYVTVCPQLARQPSKGGVVAKFHTASAVDHMIRGNLRIDPKSKNRPAPDDTRRSSLDLVEIANGRTLTQGYNDRTFDHVAILNIRFSFQLERPARNEIKMADSRPPQDVYPAAVDP